MRPSSVSVDTYGHVSINAVIRTSKSAVLVGDMLLYCKSNICRSLSGRQQQCSLVTVSFVGKLVRK